MQVSYHQHVGAWACVDEDTRGFTQLLYRRLPRRRAQRYMLWVAYTGPSSHRQTAYAGANPAAKRSRVRLMSIRRWLDDPLKRSVMS